MNESNVVVVTKPLCHEGFNSASCSLKALSGTSNRNLKRNSQLTPNYQNTENTNYTLISFSFNVLKFVTFCVAQMDSYINNK